MDIHSDLLDQLHRSYSPEPGDNLPVPKARIRDYCDARDQALILFKRAERAWKLYVARIERANKVAGKASPSRGGYFAPLEFGELQNRTKGDGDRWELYRRKIDRAGWEHLAHESSMADLMDAQAKKEFTASLDNPPPLTEENCLATFRAVLGSAESMQRRGLVTLFGKLNHRDYKSNDCFSIGRRIVVDHMFEGSFSGGLHFRYDGPKDSLIDLERAICLLTGAPVPDHLSTIVRRMEHAGIGRGDFFEDEVWKIRWFQKGTAHVYIKSEDTRTRINRELAAHFGVSMADGSGRPNHHDPHFKGKKRTRSTGIEKIDRNAFYTPPAVADLLVRESGLASYDGKICVLEPSCGHGALMLAAFRAGVRKMHGVESHVASANAAQEELAAKFAEAKAPIEHWSEPMLKIHRCDFDLWEPSYHASYSHVLMNPPFDHQLRHVVRAFGFLAKGTSYRPGGCLMAVMGVNVLTNQSEDYLTFRRWLKAKGAIVKRLAAGAFAASGTNVETLLVRIPAEMER